MSACVEATVPGCRHIDGWMATPPGQAVFCVSPHHRRAVFTHQSHPARPGSGVPDNPLPPGRNMRTKAPGGDLDTAVPGRPSDLTDRFRADGSHNWMSEVESSRPRLMWLAVADTCVAARKCGCVRTCFLEENSGI